jgi:hypothetical protein
MLKHNPRGNYRFLVAEGRPFSGGAAADEGYDLTHATFQRPVALEVGLAAAQQHLVAAGRPVQAIAGIELRIPEPLTRSAFDTFNRGYVSALKRLGLEVDGLLPASRTNVAPVAGGITEPSVYAFSYTVPASRARAAFVLSGVPETQTSDPAAILDSIMDVLSTRLQEMGCSWDDATAIQFYGVDIPTRQLVDSVLTRIGSAGLHGIQWFSAHPPILGLKFEIDARSVETEVALPT